MIDPGTITARDALATVVAASAEEDFLNLVWRAVYPTRLSLQPTTTLERLYQSVRADGRRLVALDVELAGAKTHELLGCWQTLRPAPRVLLLARDPVAAWHAGVEVGGCVYHLFTSPPGIPYLRAFLLAAHQELELIKAPPMTAAG